MQQPRARRVITRGPIRVVGKFPSIKSGHMHHWESQLERDRMHQLELDPTVLSFREQPETFEVLVNGKKHRYTPDLEVRTITGVVIEEIKPANKIKTYAPLFESVAEHLAEQGIPFRVMTDEVIRRQPYMDNIASLLRFRLLPIDQQTINKTEQLFEGKRTIGWGTLYDAFTENYTVPWQPYALLARNHILADLEAHITANSRLQLNEGAYE